MYIRSSCPAKICRSKSSNSPIRREYQNVFSRVFDHGIDHRELSAAHYHPIQPSTIMPHLPFSTNSSPSSSPKTSPSPPSIVLSPASGIQDRSDKGFSSNCKAGTSKQLYRSSEDAASAYRRRYAQYLAATFNMSLQAAMAEADAQLGGVPRRGSDVSEAEVLRES